MVQISVLKLACFYLHHLPSGFDLQDLAAALKVILRKLVLGRVVPLINKKKLS